MGVDAAAVSDDGTDGTALAIAAGESHSLAIVPEPDALLVDAASIAALVAVAERRTLT